MKGAVDGSVVNVEKTGGETNCVSCAYGPMAKIDAGPGEYILAWTEVSESKPVGDCVTEGGSDWRNDAGEEGGAMKGSTIAVDWVGFSALGALVPGDVVSGTRTACPIRFLFFGLPKHQYMLKQPPHLRFCMEENDSFSLAQKSPLPLLIHTTRNN